ncbi:hypothetical protein BDD12DRAFT_852205 [Trichophaea hybrida]|nr:hypothetical protein BDD12DRAFT_852205 [Trichophaea hybrida]
MPPRPSIPRSTTDDSDGEAVHHEISELLEKMRRSATEKRRKKREEIAAAYTKELSQVETEAVTAMTEGQREAFVPPPVPPHLLTLGH